jgi:pimeloyl-ACP methyl ester carboxylesterase
VKYVFGGMRFMAKNFPGFLKFTVRRPLLRELALAVPVSVGSRRMPVTDALRAVDDLATATAFEDTFDNTRAPFSGGRNIAVPVTVAFGDRDWILPKRSAVERASGAHQMGEKAGLGSRADVSTQSASRNLSWKAR